MKFLFLLLQVLLVQALRSSSASPQDNRCPPTNRLTVFSSALDEDGRQRYQGRGVPPSDEDTLRPLEWQELNILATTDIHGFFQGHRSEPNYSGDWGDWIDFGRRMREKANDMGVDLLLVDSGDLSDGNGLSDGFPHDDTSQAVQGHVSNQIFHFAEYDIGTIGNHELYHFDVARDIYENFAPLWEGRYLTSNVNITLEDPKTGMLESRPIGNRSYKFVSPNRNLSILAIGVLFEFKSAAVGVTVQAPSEMVQELWFQETIKQECDLFLIAAHAPVDLDPSFDLLYNAIREKNPSTPIAMLGGHTHRRSARSFEVNAMALESGRYLETIGWMSIGGFVSQQFRFSRKYIDVNSRNFAFHLGLKPLQLATDAGRYVRHLMDSIADSWKLTQLHGVAPKDYYLDRFPSSHEDSLLTLLEKEVLPSVVRPASKEGRNQSLIIINSGSQRFDIFSGPFTRNDRYIVSPFRDRFLSIQNVPYGAAKNLLQELNNSTTVEDNASSQYSSGLITNIFEGWLKSQFSMFTNEQQHSLGYRTEDSIGSDGDDTPHNPVPSSDQPAFVASNPDPLPSSDQDLVDVVFVDFILSPIVEILNRQSPNRIYSREDAKLYGDECLTTQQLYPRYAALKWGADKDGKNSWDVDGLENTWSGNERERKKGKKGKKGKGKIEL